MIQYKDPIIKRVRKIDPSIKFEKVESHSTSHIQIAFSVPLKDGLLFKGRYPGKIDPEPQFSGRAYLIKQVEEEVEPGLDVDAWAFGGGVFYIRIGKKIQILPNEARPVTA